MEPPEIEADNGSISGRIYQRARAGTMPVNDRKQLWALRDHTKPLGRSGAIRLWDDTKILPGSRWLRHLATAIDAAAIAVLLDSASSQALIPSRSTSYLERDPVRSPWRTRDQPAGVWAHRRPEYPE
ncbi:hypothetical protein WMF18_22015 [Sorangium sp. So ce315]|uniref:hypothetical protein n=1 Tax=Sorangium sp. So ce315 TaxID=3133299 RepID=UPI003F643F45